MTNKERLKARFEEEIKKMARYAEVSMGASYITDNTFSVISKEYDEYQGVPKYETWGIQKEDGTINLV